MEKKRKPAWKLFWGSLLLMIIPAAVSADPAAFELEEYVITAARTPVKITQMAAGISVITKEDIRKGNYANVTEILKQTNLLVTDKAQGTTGSTVYINGDYRVLILVDGRKVNWEYLISSGRSGFDLDRLPPVERIERVEIVRGSASSLYGSDAVGGVINIITRKNLGGYTRVAVEGGSGGLWSYGLSTGSQEQDLTWGVNYRRKQEDSYDYKEARTGQVRTMPNSHLRQEKASLFLEKDLSNGRILSLNYDHENGHAGFSMMSPTHPFHHPTAYKTWVDNNLNLTYRWRQKQGGENSVQIYRNVSRQDIYRFQEGTPSQETRSTASSANGLEWQQNWKINEVVNLVGGAAWREVEVDVPTTGIQGRKVNNKALFLESRWKFAPQYTLSLGSRYDQHSMFNGKFTSRITLNRELDRDSNVYISWGQVFKAPMIDELFGSNAYMIGNPNLQPETGDTLTLGINKRLSARTSLQFSCFRSQVKDAISFDHRKGLPWIFQNLVGEKRQGIEVNVTQKWNPHWQATVGYSYLKLENQRPDEPSYHSDADNSQPNGYRLGIQYEKGNWNADMELRGASGRNRESFTAASYWVLDLGMRKKIGKDTSVYCKIYNLTNQAYELQTISGPGMGGPGAYPMPARHIRVGLEYEL